MDTKEITKYEKAVKKYFNEPVKKLMEDTNICFWAQIITENKEYTYVTKNTLFKNGLGAYGEAINKDIYRIENLLDVLKNNYNMDKSQYKSGLIDYYDYMTSVRKNKFESIVKLHEYKAENLLVVEIKGHVLLRNIKGNPVITVGIFSNKTKQTNQEKLLNKLKQLAYIDTLTDIPNRIKLYTDYEEKELKGKYFAFLDLDGFKQINDVYGHMVGDKCLRKFSEHMAEQTEKCKLRDVQIYRVYGDEFFISFSLPENERNLVKVLESLNLGNTVECDNVGTFVKLSASIGVVEAKEKYEKPFLHFLKRADYAMYNAKENKQKRYSIFVEDEKFEKFKLTQNKF